MKHVCQHKLYVYTSVEVESQQFEEQKINYALFYKNM